MTDNIEKIVQEAECVAAADEYFKARTWLMDTTDNRRIFEAGFDRAYALLSKLAAPVAGSPRVDALMAQWDDDGATRGPAFMELRDLARSLEQRNDAIEAAISVAKESLFSQCCSNPIKNSWGKQVDLTKLNDLFNLASAPVAGEPAPYVLGNQYLTQGGDLVRLVTVANAGTSYESMACEAGIHRYTRRDFGRVTGSPHDYSDPRNIPPLYATPQASEAVSLDDVKAIAREVAADSASIRAEARKEALEDAAQQCEDIYSWPGAYSAGIMNLNTLSACASAIRALKSPSAALSAQPGAQKNGGSDA